jgi:hypothetical protein
METLFDIEDPSVTPPKASKLTIINGNFMARKIFLYTGL